MQQITSITSVPKQRMQIVLDNNENFIFELYYSTRTQSWYFAFEYKDIQVSCLKVVLTPNALRQFKKLIPFGIAFTSSGNIEPFKQDDFLSGRINIFILNEEEVKQIEQEVFNEDF